MAVDPTIVVASVTTVGVVLAASIPAALNTRATKRKAEETHKIVQGNGHGDVAHMTEQVLLIVTRLEGRFEQHVEDDARRDEAVWAELGRRRSDRRPG